MLWANKNGLLYVLDRTTGEFLMGRPFVEVNWMDGFDGSGRPAPRDTAGSDPVKPFGGTNWYPPSYSPRTGLFYVPSRCGLSIPGPSRLLTLRTGERKWAFELDQNGTRRRCVEHGIRPLVRWHFRLENAGAPQVIPTPPDWRMGTSTQ